MRWMHRTGELLQLGVRSTSMAHAFAAALLIETSCNFNVTSTLPFTQSPCELIIGDLK